MMALKARKNVPDAAEAEKEAYMVFETKDDYEAAINEELEKRSQAGAGATGANGVTAPAGTSGVTAPTGATGASGASNAQEDEGRSRLIAMWQRDAANLKLIVPEFDLSAALRNEAFRTVLSRSGNVFEAYRAMADPGESTAGRDEIFQNAQQQRRGTGEAVRNPAKLSSEDFKKYIEERRNA